MKAGQVPLARLTSIAARTLIDGLHERLVARGIHDVRPAFGYVLLAVRDAPTSGGAIASLMGMTKQAASKLVDAMVVARLVKRRDDPDDARRQQIVLLARGRRLLAEVESIYAELEAEWANVLGRERLEALRRDLVVVLEATHGGRLPRVRPA